MGTIDEEFNMMAKDIKDEYKDNKITHQCFHVSKQFCVDEQYDGEPGRDSGKIKASSDLLRRLPELVDKLNTYNIDEPIFFSNKKVWFDSNTGAIFPKFEDFEIQTFSCKGMPLANYKGVDFEGFHFTAMTENECKKSFIYNEHNPYRLKKGYRCFPPAIKDIMVKEKNGNRALSISCVLGQLRGKNSELQAALVPICRLADVDSRKMYKGLAVRAWMNNGLIPENLESEEVEIYSFLIENYKELEPFFEGVKYLRFKENEFKQWLESESSEVHKSMLANGEKKDIDLVQHYLCYCDNIRANIQPYDEKRLEGINEGHWDLYEPLAMDEEKIELPKDRPFYARPPQLDVQDNGIVAIDFGTKSTVVVRRLGTDVRLMRVGQGDYTKAPQKKDYENPTVIELRDYDSFFNAYIAREGRPFTKWEQVRFSHDAANALQDAESDALEARSVFYSIFSELKQWANDKDRRMKLKDRKGHVIELKPYMELMDNDFDPIELYAYYLGLYINNMHNGICLEYMMSFPVTYEKAIREKIIQSFTKGLKKSLPTAILQDKDMMERFEVYAGASEPAAYASCALGELGLQPEAGGQTAYAVFDFGGGTTDFDFGVEKVPENKRFKYVIEQFPSAGRGDPYLGGENLLHTMAYEVYKENYETIREKQIPFVLPYGASIFVGTESLVKKTNEAPQEGYVNTKHIVEKLRPYWEGTNDDDFFSKDMQVKLYSNATQKIEDIPLKVEQGTLDKCLNDAIQRGVENFFEALKGVFYEKGIYPIHILLAGNSCKSPIVKEIFDKEIEVVENELKEKIAAKSGDNKNIPKIIELHMPLGYEETADQEADKTTSNGESAESKENDKTSADEQPAVSMGYDQLCTGKTGVAFGLLRSRKSGRDIRLLDTNEEAPFPFYIGEEGEDGKFKLTIGMDVPYNSWRPYTFADNDRFELYYTRESIAVDNDLDITRVSTKTCRLNESELIDNDDAHVYVRKVAPDTIEYVTGLDKDFDNEGYEPEKERIHTQTL